MMFHVGQKVVCVKSPPPTWLEWWFNLIHPSKYPEPAVGEIYTIANIYSVWDGELQIEVVELYAPEEKHWLAGFKAERFRPVVERKTDISIFQRLLTPTDKVSA